MIGIKSINITQELLQQLCDVDIFKGIWTGLERHSTGLQLLGDVADYGSEFEALLGPLKEQPITADIIRVLHATQVGGKGMSDFKTQTSSLEIRGKDGLVGVLQTAEPDDVPILLKKLCDWVNSVLTSGDTPQSPKSQDNTLHPIITAAVFTSVFLQISPFERSNMAVLRFLLMLVLLKGGYTYAPYVALGPLMEERAAKLYTSLRDNQASLESGRPDWSGWITCFLEILQAQKDVLYTRLYDKEAELQNLPALSAKIMALLRKYPRLQMKEIINLTNGRRATIKLRLSELLEGGYLRRHGQGRSTWYALV